MPARKAASLCGLINPVDATPAFAVPIFQWEGGGNDLLVQVIDRDGRVENFITVEIGRYALNQEVEAVRLEVGQPALWAFQWDTARWLVTNREALSEELVSYSEAANPAPLLELAIARFVGHGAAHSAVVRKAFDHLSRYSPESAVLWRDLVILLPAARMAIQRGLPEMPKAVQRAIDDLMLDCEGSMLRMRVPSKIVTAFDGDRQQLRGALNAIQSLTDAFDIHRLEIVEVPDSRLGDPGSESDGAPRPLVTLVPLSQIGGSLASAVGKHPGIRTIGVDGFLTGSTSKLSPDIDARAGDLFLILLADRSDEISDAERLASSLVGRGCLAAAIVVRPYHAASMVGSDNTDSDRRFDKLARTARWVAIIGGPQTSGHALQPLVGGAEPSRNSPTHIGKWLVRAFLGALQGPQAGREALDLAFERARGPKFAAVGVGSASGATAVKTAVAAAYASAKASLLDPYAARSVAAFLIRGPSTDIAARQQCVDLIKGHARPETVASVHETVLPTMKKRVRVVLLARGFPTDSFSWTPPTYLRALRDHGWNYTRLAEQGENLDLEIWQGSAEFGVIVDLDRRLTNRAEIDAIASTAPMYRGPVVLILGYLPDIKIRNQLLLHGIISVSIDRFDLLDNLSHQPLRTILSRLLRARPTEILAGMAVFIRDHLMRILWRGDADVAIWERSPVVNEPFEIPGWLTETEPPEGKLEPFELDGRGPGRVLFFSGVLHITPAERKAGHPVAFGFKIAIDDRAVRLREPMRFGFGQRDGAEDGQLKLDF